MDLSKLTPANGARKKRKRLGRGQGSGTGVTAGRGDKGYKSRSGSKSRSWFEGGQMPLQRRLPKFGFVNIYKKEYQVVNIQDLERLKKKENITPEVLFENGLIRKKRIPVKLLGKGDLKSKVSIKVDAVSKSAQEKIEKQGGTVTLL